MKPIAAFALAVMLPASLAGCFPSGTDRAPIIYTQWPFDADEAKRRQKETAERLGVPVEKAIDLGNGVKLELVLVPAGEFDMGSPEGEEDRYKGEGPVHRVRITKPFYMEKYEVTQEVWEGVIGNNPGTFKGARNPVETVSWDNCQDFLKKLNALGKDKGTFRLPTEAEWEYACRAGTKTRFCFGDSDTGLSEHAWYEGNSYRMTHPVGEKKPNAWSLHDMHGNVWEWCEDWYEDYYGKSPKDDPTGPAAGSARVLRGGSWGNIPGGCRSACRGGNKPGVRNVNRGFRVMLPCGGP